MYCIHMPYADKKAQREFQRNWLHKRRSTWLVTNGPCVKCGSTRDLEVDHVDPSQKLDHKVWSWSESRRDTELAKCQVLCRKCHLKKTVSVYTPKHGTRNMYLKHGCRCVRCRTENSSYIAEWRQKRATGI